MRNMKNIINKWNSVSLVLRIICGLILGIILGLTVPQASGISILGQLFVGALKGVAPILVFFLVMSALCRMGKGQKTNMKFIRQPFICACSRTGKLRRSYHADAYRGCWKWRRTSERCSRSIDQPAYERCGKPGRLHRKCKLYWYSCVGGYLRYCP